MAVWLLRNNTDDNTVAVQMVGVAGPGALERCCRASDGRWTKAASVCCLIVRLLFVGAYLRRLMTIAMINLGKYPEHFESARTGRESVACARLSWSNQRAQSGPAPAPQRSSPFALHCCKAPLGRRQKFGRASEWESERSERSVRQLQPPPGLQRRPLAALLLPPLPLFSLRSGHAAPASARTRWQRCGQRRRPLTTGAPKPLPAGPANQIRSNPNLGDGDDDDDNNNNSDIDT